jgi:hypothetical protein
MPGPIPNRKEKVEEYLENPPEGLSLWGLQALAHWKEHRPKMVRELEQEGKLLEMVLEAVSNTLEALYRLEVEKKVPANQAWEMMREEWLFLPPEK